MLRSKHTDIPLADVLSEAEMRLTIDSDAVVVVQDDQLAEAKMAGKTGGLRADALLQTAVAAEHVGVVVKNVKSLVNISVKRADETCADKGKYTGLLYLARR